MITQAKGSFTVVTNPASEHDRGGGFKLGRLSLEKHYTGDVTATGHGQMLTAMTEVQGSAAYVALEHVSGSVHGKSGSFVLQHTGVMDKGIPTLHITVVPDSGTDELTGLSGRCQIVMDPDGAHHYVLDYALARQEPNP